MAGKADDHVADTLTALKKIDEPIGEYVLKLKRLPRNELKRELDRLAGETMAKLFESMEFIEKTRTDLRSVAD